jgi:sporulation protein YlmC with PRC-barrel domain
MKRSRNLIAASYLFTALFAGPAFAQQPAKGQPQAPVVGTATGVIGVSVEEQVMVARGWSMKKQILGKNVFNDKNEKLGKIEDVIVTPDKSLSYAIVGVGGFLGAGRHDVAIPINQLKADNDRFVIHGATKDTLKILPKFEYSKEAK